MIYHIKTIDFLKYLLISIPMISAMTCGIIFIIVYNKSLSTAEHKLRLTLGGYYFLIVFMWLITIISIENFQKKLYLIPILFSSIHLIQVCFFNFFNILTYNNYKKNNFHYKLTFILFILFNVLLYVLHSTKGYEKLDIYHFFYNYLYIYTSLTMFYYASLCWLKLYKLEKQKKTNLLRLKQFNWIHLLLIIRTVSSVLFSFNNHRYIIIDASLVFLIPIQHILITYNILNRFSPNHKKNIMLSSGQIISITNNENTYNLPTDSINSIEVSTILTEEDIISYFTKEKPYLNKKFKLNDLIKHFTVNRTYMSKFINVTFQTNVSQYINQWRLKEVELLQKSNPKKSIEEIALSAGFSNFRHYQRAKQNNHQQTLGTKRQ